MQRTKRSQQSSTFLLVPLLAILSAIVAFSIDIYLPLIPIIKKNLSANTAEMQWSLALFFIGFALSQLFLGVVADNYGKRKVLLSGLCIYAVGSLMCAYSDVAAIFIIGRVVQAIGACAVMLVSLSIVRDVYSGQENLRAYAYITLTITCAPAVAPPLGSYISYFFSWRAVFIFLFILALLLFVFCLKFLPETSVKRAKRFQFNLFLSNYKSVFKERIYRLYLYCSVVTMAALMAFVTGSPYLLMLKMKVSSTQFSWYFAFNAIVMIVSSFIATRLATRFSPFQLVRVGAYCLLFAALIMLLNPIVTPWRFLIPMIPASFAIALLMPSTMSGLMSPFPHLTASASALTGCLRYITAAIIAFLVIIFFVHIAIFIPLVFLVAALVCLLSIKTLKKCQV